MIDLRSDTVTKPSKEMLEYMLKAELGDDVFGEDPTVTKLEEQIAGMAGMEAAVFSPTGTQSNLLGIMSHCQRGDEYIVGQTAHTYMFEGGGAAILGSIQPQPLDFDPDGTLDLDKVYMAIKPDDFHFARTKLLCLENTTTGRVLPLDYLKKIPAFCKENKLASHLDGARVFNAVSKLGVSLETITQNFDSVSICLSKGLGTPLGSVLCGSKELIKEARKWRKMLGGGMRQAGIVAAAGIYALEHNIERLREDHDNAELLAKGLGEIDAIQIVAINTNILLVKINKHYPELREELFKNGVIFPKAANKSGIIRLVTHLDVSTDDILKTTNLIKAFYHKQ